MKNESIRKGSAENEQMGIGQMENERMENEQV